MITRLQVRNFKSLRSLDLTLGPLNVLVGRNMVGKSNILDVFRFLYQVFFPEAGTQGISYALAQRGGINEILWKGGSEKLVSFTVEAVDDADSKSKYSYELQLIAGAGDFVSVQKESLKLTREGREIDLLVEQGGMRRFFNADGKDLGAFGSSGMNALQYAPPNWGGFQFYTLVAGWRFYHLVPPAMRRPSAMGLGQTLMPNGENLSAWLMWLQTTSPDAFRRINEVVTDLFPDILQLKSIPSQAGNVHLAVQEKELTRPTTVWQASDGVLCLIALLSLIYATPGLLGPLFCVEEPENHLHPSLWETLVTLFRQVQQERIDAKVGPLQILLTTQSPYLVDQMSLDEIIWVEKKNGETTASRPNDKKHLRKLVQDKEVGLGDLVYSGTLGEEQ